MSNVQVELQQRVTTTSPPMPLAPAFLLETGDAANAERVTVCTISDAQVTLFIDGQSGCDTRGDGSWRRPFASLRAALQAAESVARPQVCIAAR